MVLTERMILLYYNQTYYCKEENENVTVANTSDEIPVSRTILVICCCYLKILANISDEYVFITVNTFYIV